MYINHPLRDTPIFQQNSLIGQEDHHMQRTTLIFRPVEYQLEDK
jgi:hypothetical protein